MHQERFINQTYHRGRWFICNANRVGSTGASVFQDLVNVLAFAGLRHANYQRVLQVELCAVEGVDRRRRKGNRNAGGNLEQVAAEEGGVVGAASGYEYD